MRPMDMSGKEIQLNDTVARAIKSGNAPMIMLCKVTRIDSDGKVYLDNSSLPIVYPDYLLVVPGYTSSMHHTM